MTTPTPDAGGKVYWKGLEELAQDPRFVAMLHREFPEEATEIEMNGVSRRTFLGIMGASLSLMGLANTGCIRKTAEKTLPFTKKPEDLIPGRPEYYATSALIGGSVLGLLVESQDGRPTKIEGNPKHPSSRGATSVWAQAEILSLYDPDRAKGSTTKAGAAPAHDDHGHGGHGAPAAPAHTPRAETEARLAALAAAFKAAGGAKLGLLVEHTASPSFEAAVERFVAAYPGAKVFRDDPAAADERRRAFGIVGAAGYTFVPRFDQADVVVTLDGDPFGIEGDTVRNARGWAERRKVDAPGDTMSRLYTVEPAFTVTGLNADHRLRVKGSEIGAFLTSLLVELKAQGLYIAPEARPVFDALDRAPKWTGEAKFVKALAKDLLAHLGFSLIYVGERQPATVQALGLFTNAILGNFSNTLAFYADPTPAAGTLADLATAVGKGEIESLVVVGANPAYTAPADLDFAAKLGALKDLVVLGALKDETGAAATLHVARSHWLESWGDTRAADGTVSIRQPLIDPIFETLSELEFVARLAGDATSAYELVRAHWKAKQGLNGDFEAHWRRWLHDGVIESTIADGRTPGFSWAGLPAAVTALPAPAPVADGVFELDFRLDASVYDGRWANNGWLQELPDPWTKITWDNALLLAPSAAAKLKLKSGDQVTVSLGERTLTLPVHPAPGTADGTAVLHLGYGRRAGGKVLTGVGFDAGALRTTAFPVFAPGARIEKARGSYKIAQTQTHHSMEGRPIVRETTLVEFTKKPDFAKSAVAHPALEALWTPPNETAGNQWGMVIDLNACTGCNACTIACQAENSIPIVGKERVAQGREMHWIRLDRYFSGSPDDPEAVVQPVGCVHCENAPCESVCPVAATVHGAEGTNDMAYNRCIGTRYCANNCPYKVRRFNFFNYQKENEAENPYLKLQRNPDVTVRFRGVMEKCSYCIQRVQEVRQAHKVEFGNDAVPDGAVQTACQQACPTRAITFGNISDPESKVAALKRSPRDYAILAELNTKPRTTYLAKIRNPNADLA